ncbi:hypothetical protein CBR_g17814 [Chara braunii]|uniref:Bifunctional inhibitor/plant lipid transfer protein/seed storage helical domain-containing protein n=1 Tax=Chara braunii TaxID=69332 RepID=A0A388KVY3_CHABU|nr:hypothetical protein CBR_g17814 [Chara braunii]|eukprot:GBG74103.1 hypothetical protein CBR_g17814 [Chara braunii]
MAATCAAALSILGVIIAVLTAPNCLVEGNVLDAIGQVASQLSIPTPSIPCLDEYQKVEAACPADIQTPEQCPKECRQELKKFDACATKASQESGMVNSSFTDSVNQITSTCGADVAALASSPLPDAVPSDVVAGAAALASNPNNAMAEASKVVAQNSRAIADGASTLVNDPQRAISQASEAANALASNPAKVIAQASAAADAQHVVAVASEASRRGVNLAAPSAPVKKSKASSSSPPAKPSEKGEEPAMPSEPELTEEEEMLWFRTSDDQAFASMYTSNAVRVVHRTTCWLAVLVSVLVALLFRA